MRANKSYRKVLAMILAMALVCSYSMPINAFAGVRHNTASIVKEGSTLYYDENGDAVENFDLAAVAISKTIKALSDDNEFQIDLNVKTKKEVQTSTVEKDSATVLVMDLSSSMVATDGDYLTRLDEAKKAAKKFLESYVKDAGNAKREISIVVFASGANRYLNWTDANGKNKGYKAVADAIDNINWGNVPQGGNTNIEGGLILARNLFNVQNISSIDNKNVILLTDGVPNMYSDDTNNQNHVWGKSRYWSNDSYDDVPVVCGEIRALGSNVYSVCYGVEEQLVYKISEKWIGGPFSGQYEHERISISQWLNNRVKVTKNYSADNASELYNSFSNINEQIEETMTANGMIIQDPMGPFILFDSNNQLSENITFEGNKYKVKLIAEDSVTDGNIKEYKYSYKIKLDVNAQGFEENKEYDTNGRTTLTFKYGNNPEAKTVDFTIPSVKGIVPEVPYTIEYYKWDKDKQDYPEEPTEVENGGKAKLWSQVNVPEGYDDKYSSDNYHFVEGDSVLQLIASENGNILKLKYMPDLANVIVNHYYKTDVIHADGTKTEATDYELKSTVTKENLYVGDKFEAELISDLDGIKYTLNGKESDSQRISSLKNGQNTINLYYDGLQDLRKTTSITVNRIYKTGHWEINEETGRYEEVFLQTEPQEYENNTNVKAHSTFLTSTIEDVEDGYFFEKTDNGNYDVDKNQVALELKEEENIINITFVKNADKSILKTAKVKVNHNYYLTEKKIVDGKLETIVPQTPVTDIEEYSDYYVGEYFTPGEVLTYNDIDYNSDSDNEDKIKTYELGSGTLEVNLSYHQMIEPKATNVTVNHIYRSFDTVYEEIEDEETGEITINVRTVTESGINSEVIDNITIDDEEQKLYVGFEYTAAKNGEFEGKTYNFNEEDSTKDGEIVLGEEDNVIELYYDLKTDSRPSADVEVHHIYKTMLTTVEEGKIITKNAIDYAGIVDEETDKYLGQAGDIFDITTHEELDGKTYKVKGDVPENITLTPGTNKTIEVVYEREDSDLKAATFTVVHKYIEKIMTVVDGVAGYYGTDEAEVVATINTFTVNEGEELTEEIYVGEKYTVDLAPNYDGIEYTADSANPGTDIILADGEGANALEYKYIRMTELTKTSVTVNHHYSHSIINKVGETSVITEENTVPMLQPYIGEDVKVVANKSGYDYSNVTVSGTDKYVEDSKNDIALTVSNAAVIVDYYYTKTTDNSEAASWKVNHYYRVIDWNDSNDKEYALDEIVSSTGDSYATKTITGVPNLKSDDAGNATYTLDKARATSDLTDGYTMTLQSGTENEINFYYTQHKDSRVGTVVKVIHNYYKHDTSGLIPDSALEAETTDGAIEVLPGVLAGTYEEVFTGKNEKAWVGNSFTADKKTIFGEDENELIYAFKDADPKDCTIKYLELADADDPNLIVINYVYDYDASENITMKVNHVYKTHDSYTDKITEEVETVIAKFGNDEFGAWNKEDKVFTSKEILKSGFARQTSDDDMSVTYNAGSNEITIIYSKDVSSKPSSGGGGGSHKPNKPSTPPTTDIPEEPVPLVENPVIIEDEQVPLNETPIENNGEEILDEDVPLAELPKTGGSGMAGFFGIGAALLALGVFMRRREEEK